MKNIQHHSEHNNGAISQLRMTLAASLLILTQVASASDEIGITAAQRQLSFSGTGIVTLRFEVENRSGSTQELQENINLPPGWQLITNTAPFLLNNNGRDVRLIHVSLPQGANAGNYQVSYQVSSSNNGAIASSESVNIRLEAEAGTELSRHQAPGSLLEGEKFIVDYVVKNTGNQTINYTFAAHDSDSFITSIKPRKTELPAGHSKIIRVSGRVNTRIHETGQYSVTLQARGAGNRADHSINIPLIARTPKGVGKYQKLPGKLSFSSTWEQNQDNHQQNPEADENSRAFQLEYFARGRIDEAGEHNVEIRLRNGEQQGHTSLLNQLEEYYVEYWNDELKVKTGHQSFSTTRLIGNSLSGVGASASFQRKDQEGHSPLKLEGFYGRTRPGEEEAEHSVFAALTYDWGDYEVGASLLKTRKEQQDGKDEQHTIGSVSGTWRGENITTRAEVATDNNGGSAFSADVSGQWQDLGFNASVTRADSKFGGSINDAMQTYANLHYKLDEKNSISFYTRHKQENLDDDISQEIRSDNEQQIRYKHTIGDADQASISVGYRQRKEKDKRPSPTTDRTTKAATIEYRHRFDEFDISIAAEKGRREDNIDQSQDGTRGEFSVNWRPTHALNLGTSFAVSQDLDNPGKTTSMGFNSLFKINSRSSFNGYVQYNKNEADDSHSRSYELQYKYDLKKYGEFGIRARRVDNLAGNGERDRDHAIQFEYSLPLDVPFRKRRNVGAVQGTLRNPDNSPARDIVMQMDGQYAVTDQNGQFFYPHTVAKDYQINIDNTRPNAMGLMLDGTAKLNKIQVHPDSTVMMDLTLQQGARLQGKLAQFTTDTGAALFDNETNKGSLREERGIGMVLLELRPKGEIGNRITHRRSTLFDGSFSFMGIPPGEWELAVVDTSRVPDNYRLEQKSYLVDLTAGSNQNLLIRALPTKQTIKKNGPKQGFNVSG